MDSKKIYNIVFFKYYDGRGENRRACIFYDNGEVEDASYEDGILACKKVAKDNNISSENAFAEMINKNIVHVVSGDYLESHWDDFKPAKYVNSVDFNDDEEAEVEDAVNADDEFENEDEDESQDEADIEDEDMFDEDIDDEIDYSDDDKIDEEIEDEIAETENESKIAAFFKNKAVKVAAIGTAIIVGLGAMTGFAHKSKEGKILKNNISTSTTDEDNLASRDTNDLVKGVAFDIDNTDEEVKAEAQTTDEVSSETQSTTEVKSGTTGKTLSKGNNDLYNEYTYEELLEVTECKSQKVAMTNLYTTITEFNGEFAKNYTEVLKVKGKKMTVKPALKFDEVASLQVAYNAYSKTELKAYFNGAEVDAKKMDRAYKDASLQLMGAYILESKEHQVDMSHLIESKEGKEFYQRYHKMFIEAKTATGAEKIKKVQAFYKAVRKDFPVTKKVRTEGIAHADTYASITDYKLAVTPMIAAAEMLFQNLQTDYTLNDSEIDFINDIGLCNYAEQKFEKIQTITLSFDEDKTNPTYMQFRKALIKMLKAKSIYAVSDEHRELTNLRLFASIINWHFNMIEGAEWSYNGGFYQQSTTRTEVETWTETTTSYYEETTYTEKEMPADIRAQIDAQIEAENQAAYNEALAASEAERQRIQAEEDRKAAEIYRQIEEEEKDFQRRIDHANEKIDDGGKVNESDFGDHNVDFFPDYSDNNGNLDSSVENITTDPTGDQTNQPLPDPNQTGAEFDAKAENYYNNTQDYSYDNTQNYSYDNAQDYSYDNTQNYSYEDQGTGNVQDLGNGASIEYPSDYNYQEYSGGSYVEYEASNDALVNDYINSMSGQSMEESYQYTR